MTDSDQAGKKALRMRLSNFRTGGGKVRMSAFAEWEAASSLGAAQGGVPRLAGHVGMGPKVFGPVSIGETALVGANAVVVRNVSAGSTVVGIPARVVHSGEAHR